MDIDGFEIPKMAVEEGAEWECTRLKAGVSV